MASSTFPPNPKISSMPAPDLIGIKQHASTAVTFHLAGWPPASRSAKARRTPNLRVVDDPPLHPSGNGFHLGAADPLQDLVRNRSPCGGCTRGTRRDPET